jgi:hypothetical protein
MNNDKHQPQGPHDDLLPRELVWDGAHVTELALTAIADGQQSIVQRDAVQHAEACEWCAGRMARAALLSAAVGGAVATYAGTSQAAKASRPIERAAPAPWKALTMGLAVAVLAALPSLPHLAGIVIDVVGYAKLLSQHGVSLIARGGVALATNETLSRGLPVATAVSSVLLVLMGWAIARTRSRETFERSMS